MVWKADAARNADVKGWVFLMLIHFFCGFFSSLRDTSYQGSGRISVIYSFC